jgi:twitching motility protein PilI
MANREALRELQARLARRLNSEGAETQTASWLAFECSNLGVVVALPAAGEIFSVTAPLPVPHTKPWFLGVANLRGQLHGVVDLAAFLGLRAPLCGAQLHETQRASARFLAFNPTLGSHCAVLVDRLVGLRSTHQMQQLPAPQAAASPAFAPAVWQDADGRTWQELDLALLARHEQYLAIAL